ERLSCPAGLACGPAPPPGSRDPGGVLDESDTTVVHNGFLGQPLAFHSLNAAIRRLPHVTHTCTEVGRVRCHPNP
ncbi:MAG TPA: hypothetical protein PKE34_09710, partial [Marmoricola sp.]|nr:hypothetical protein [Marmoricola sp.]